MNNHSLKQEYTTMSRRPGIAADWFAKYFEDVYPSDSIYVNGRVMRPPKYYDDLFKKESRNTGNLRSQKLAKRRLQ
jgi:hypothetical protein